MGAGPSQESAAGDKTDPPTATAAPTGAGPPPNAPASSDVTEPVFLAGDVKLAEGAVLPTGPPQQRAEGKLESIMNYKISKTLGQGAYGKVKLATNVTTGHSVAVKVIDRSKLVDRPQGTQHLVREINTMKILRHANVVRLHEVIHTPAKIFMVMEFAQGGDLLAYLNANGRLSEARAAALFSGLCDGLLFCHKLGVCHRDLKLENLLLAEAGGEPDSDGRPRDVVKIADFGMAALAPPASHCKTLCGSPDYAAPEILQEVAHYDGELSDAWSSGVILYALLCRRLPFQAHQGDIHALFASIRAGDFSIPPHVSAAPSDLLSRLLATDPSKRATIAHAHAHPWLRSAAPRRKPIQASVSMDVPRRAEHAGAHTSLGAAAAALAASPLASPEEEASPLHAPLRRAKPAAEPPPPPPPLVPPPKPPPPQEFEHGGALKAVNSR